MRAIESSGVGGNIATVIVVELEVALRDLEVGTRLMACLIRHELALILLMRA
jgi:hypothetical protein